MIDTTDKLEVVNMIQSSGYGPLPGTSITPASAANAPPPPVIKAPPNPDAVPARCGRTDNIPEVALGSTIPFPKPTSVTEPKNASGVPNPRLNSTSGIAAPNPPIVAPTRTILFAPNRIE